MQTKPTPLLVSGRPASEAPLPKSPLVRVVAQVQFPPILSILKAGSVADFQESLRSSYPHLDRHDVKNIEIRERSEAKVSDTVIWRFSDQHESIGWRVSLGIDFVALETWSYVNRNDFVNRFRAVLESVHACFGPAMVQRLGLRYINRLEGDAFHRIGNLIHPSVLGILQTDGKSLDKLRKSMAIQMTVTQFVAEEGVIQSRWGVLPSNTTYDSDLLQAKEEPSWVLDLDMFAQKVLPFKPDDLIVTTETFAEHVYFVFCQVITDEFLKFYGGTT